MPGCCWSPGQSQRMKGRSRQGAARGQRSRRRRQPHQRQAAAGAPNAAPLLHRRRQPSGSRRWGGCSSEAHDAQRRGYSACWLAAEQLGHANE